MVIYQNTQLAKGSKALELYNQWKKSGKSEDKRLLDSHVKEVQTNERNLLERYK